jgi:hypothetical protein
LEGCRRGDRAENSDCCKKRPDEVTQKKNVKMWEYRGADKSLDRPGRKQVTATEDFDFHISYL